MDKPRHLKFGINALIQLEQELGRPLSEMTDAFKMSDLRDMLYVGLKWEDKSLTKEQVGDAMDCVIANEGISALTEKLGEAMGGSLGNNALPSDK